MAYIYKKIIRGKPYYYLRVSKRVKGKIVVKDIAYLGRDLTKLETKLEALPSAYKQEIRKAYRNIKKNLQEQHYLKKVGKLKKNPYVSEELLREVEAIKLHFQKHFLKQSKQTVAETYKSFVIDFAFNTTSIEGNTITLVEAEKLLREQLTPKNRTIHEVYDVQNTEKVFFEILHDSKELSHDFIIRIHDQLMENIDDRKGYRAHDIRVFKARFEATPARYVKIDIDMLLQWYKQYEKKLHPLMLAGLFHQKFERIHPFADGNGRTGRMILCFILLKHDYPPLTIRKTKRGDYLDALAKGDTSELNSIDARYYKNLIHYLAKEYTTAYWNTFNI